MTRYMSGAISEAVVLAPDRWRFYEALAAKHGVTPAQAMSEVLRRFAAADDDGRARALAGTTQPAVTPRRRSTSPTSRYHDQIVALLDEGKSDTTIARELGIGQVNVSRYRRLNLKRESNGRAWGPTR
ncbi:hypothetical protein ACLBWP_03450 [Microbacterium sp. M1A1_1b]